MAITVISGAVSAAVWTTDKVMITTGTNSVTASVALSAKPTANVLLFLYNDGTGAGNGSTLDVAVPIVCPANTKTEIYVGVGNQLTTVGGNSTAAAIGTASSANSGVYN
jgi:hypothetical protein|tara:strand:- start:215 stop:541 length:327 start_codon:yes stop_codon:yes gene_type:complete